jgi:hypothetical protein
LFARLGVFVGGCTLDAATPVCNPTNDLPVDVTQGMTSLLDKSLLQQEGGVDGELRFLMLETIREYALERLAASGEADHLRRQHALYYLGLAEGTATLRRDANWIERLAWLEAEYDNLRAALAWSQAAAGDARIGLRLARELLFVWMQRGYWTEARSWLTRVLTHPEGAERTVLRAQVLTSAGLMLVLLNDYVAAQAAFAESLAICDELGDTHERAWVLERLGWLAREQGDVTLARLAGGEPQALPGTR